MTRMRAEARREALVGAAMRVVAEHGVSAATTRAIVAEAGMSLASFHYAFDSRDQLMVELVEHVIAQEERSIAPALENPSEAIGLREAIRGGLQYYFEALRADPLRETAMFELTHYAMRSAGMQRLARRQYASYYAMASRALAVASEQSGQGWRRPVAELAVLLVSLTDGLTMAWLVNRDDEAAEEIMDFAADAMAAFADPHPMSAPESGAPAQRITEPTNASRA